MLHVGQAPALWGTGGGLSTQFTLTGDVQNPGTYTLPNLEALPSTALTATYLSGATSVTDTYTGVSL
jgi:DMSO/TMAO reductase YedYZ molybdopterin-dependent catalytic subunit